MSDTTTQETLPFDKVISADGKIEIPIWRRESDKGWPSYSFDAAQRTYFDKDQGEFKRTTVKYDQHASELASMHKELRDRISEHRRNDYLERMRTRQHPNEGLEAANADPSKQHAQAA